MNLHLVWGGPVGPSLIPSDPESLAALDQPGVYLRTKRYEGGRVVAYVGQSRQLLTRFDQHVVNALGLTQPLRDSRGRPAYDADFASRLAAYNDLERAAKLACEEARRTRFYHALCVDGFDPDHLDLVEGELMRRVERRLAAHAGCPALENRIAAPGADADTTYRIESDFTGLGVDDRGLLETLVGREPMLVGAAWASA